MLMLRNFTNQKGRNTMTSFVRISDIPPEELHLLPIIGLRQQIRLDRLRPSIPNHRTGEGVQGGFRPGQTFHTEIPAAEVWAATEERFVTDWQLQDEPLSSARFPIDREDSGDDEDREDENFGDEEDEDGDEKGVVPASENHPAGDNFEALYVDLGGEG
jgi:hypothetical protein